jgi:hypothetical protein
MPNRIGAIMTEFITVMIKHAEKRSKSEAERIYSVSGTEIKECQLCIKIAISITN